VSDTGPGLSSEVLPHIFEPFFTTKEVGLGAGLGLAQVYGIVKQHEGEIEVGSQIGQGTTFKLYLPMPASLPEPLPPMKQVEMPEGHGETLLLVEGEPVVQEVIQAMLERLDYYVLGTTDGQEALKIYDCHGDEISLVLTDLTTPELGGMALVQALQERNPAVRVVVLTEPSMEEEPEIVRTQSIVDWLQKPLSFGQLAQTISQSLQS
jgi:CheY-like chemotaxis protein